MRSRRTLSWKILAAGLTLGSLRAQPPSHIGMTDMNEASMSLMNLASGTSQNPAAVAHAHAHDALRKLEHHVHGHGVPGGHAADRPARRRQALLTQTRSWPRRNIAPAQNGAFEAVLMLSLEAATITDRRYPLLFQTGETAYGIPLVDGQHPHNFIMGAGRPLHTLAERGHQLDVYFAPVGDPALGPGRLPAPRVGHGAAPGDAVASLAGFDAHRRRSRYRGTLA